MKGKGTGQEPLNANEEDKWNFMQIQTIVFGASRGRQYISWGWRYGGRSGGYGQQEDGEGNVNLLIPSSEEYNQEIV